MTFRLVVRGSRDVVIRGSVVVGRDASSAIVLDDQHVSSAHARLEETDEGLVLTDLDSSNGTFVNGRLLLGSTVVRPGDEIRIGGSVLVVAGGEQPAIGRGPAGGAASPVLTIGRDPASGLVLSDPMVSWVHATLTREQNGHVLTDAGSSNGTFINGVRVRSRRLEADDHVLMGTTAFVFDGRSLVATTDRLRGVDVEVRDVSLHIGEHQLLDGVSARFRPNELVAVIGGSGAGKSTLLRTLAGVTAPTSGRIKYDGADFWSSLEALRPTVGYVPQSDVVHRKLTVRRALDYAARLRLPDDWTDADRAERLAEALEQVDLANRADLPIERLSGGQVKRVSVALELLGNPRLLLLDEPTSGLDPSLDRRMMRLFRDLASDGRTVVVVTHSVLHLDLCDRVLLLAPGGRVAYDGPPGEMVAAFGVTSYADAFASAETGSRAVPAFAAAVATDPVAARQPSLVPRGSFVRQATIVGERAFELVIRDRRNLVLLLAQAPLIALLLIAVMPADVFGDVDVPAPATQTVAFSLAIIAVWFGLINAIREITKERPIIDRERLAGLRPGAYVAAKVAPLLSLIVLQCAVLVTLTSAKSGIAGGAVVFSGPVDEFVSLTAGGLCATAIALLVSAFAENEDRATSAIPFLLIPQFLLAGVTFPLGAATGWVSQLMLGRWVTEAVGGSVGMCRHVPPPAACDSLGALDYPADSSGLLFVWFVITAGAVALLVLTAAVMRRQRLRL